MQCQNEACEMAGDMEEHVTGGCRSVELSTTRSKGIRGWPRRIGALGKGKACLWEGWEAWVGEVGE